MQQQILTNAAFRSKIEPLCAASTLLTCSFRLICYQILQLVLCEQWMCRLQEQEAHLQCKKTTTVQKWPLSICKSCIKETRRIPEDVALTVSWWDDSAEYMGFLQETLGLIWKNSNLSTWSFTKAKATRIKSAYYCKTGCLVTWFATENLEVSIPELQKRWPPK